MKFFRSLVILTLLSSAALGQEKKESLKFNFPQTYTWRTEVDNPDSTAQIRIMIPENELAKKGGLKVFLTQNDGELFVPMEIAMNNIVNKARQISPKLTMQLIERDKDEKNHWIIFKIESAATYSQKGVESRLYYILQGNSALYTTYVTISGKSFPDDLMEQWKAVFKTSVLE